MPDWTDEIRRRLAAAKLASEEEADIAEELAQHLDDRYRELRQRGVGEDDARRTTLDDLASDGTLAALVRAARRTRASESVALGGARGGGALSGVWNNLRYALRSLRRAPGFACIAVLTLALGIGATAAIFSVVNIVVLRPLPYPDADRVVMVWMDNRRQGNPEDWHSSPNFTDLRNQNEVLSGLAAYQVTGLNLTGTSGEPERVDAVIATADHFEVLQTRPLLGQLFTAEQEVFGRSDVVLLSYGLWARAFGSDPGIVGKTIRLNGRPSTVLGVMADMRRTGLDSPVRDETFQPLAQDPPFSLSLVVHTTGDPLALAPAVRRAVHAIDPEQPVYDIQSMEQQLGGMVAQRRFSMELLGAFAALALVLALVGVYGVTSYLVAQRTREIGVRLALGAEPGTVVRMVVRQGMGVALAGESPVWWPRSSPRA
jgi:putative ABC transport system permease protein